MDDLARRKLRTFARQKRNIVVTYSRVGWYVNFCGLQYLKKCYYDLPEENYAYLDLKKIHHTSYRENVYVAGFFHFLEKLAEPIFEPIGGDEEEEKGVGWRIPANLLLAALDMLDAKGPEAFRKLVHDTDTPEEFMLLAAFS